MFKRLRVRNFRSIRDSGNLRFSRLNIIVGPNSSGKSSLLYTMLMLKQTLDDKNTENVLVTSGPQLDLGSYLDIIPKISPKEDLEVEFDLDESFFPDVMFSGGGRTNEFPPFNKYQVKFGFDLMKNTVYVKSFHLVDTQSKSEFAGKLENSKWVLDGVVDKIKPHAQLEFDHFLPCLGPKGKIPKDKEILELSVEILLNSHLRFYPTECLFERIRYVAPIRQHIPRYGVLGTMPHTELGASGQNLIRVLSQRSTEGPSGRAILKELNKWLGTRFKILKNIRLVDIDKSKTIKLLIADEHCGRKPINLAEMGSGISQLVPVIVQTVLTPKKGCILIEQPEIHLHPAAQADLADLFAHYAAHSDKQIIIETHSEHLVLRIRRRIAEGKLCPDLVRIYFVQKYKTGQRQGETKVRELELEKNGHFKKWPIGFFEDGYKEAMAILDAQLK